jgi:hypothetical protein
MRLHLIIAVLGMAALAAGCARQDNAHSPPRVTSPTTSDASKVDVITPGTSATTTVTTASAERASDAPLVNPVDSETAKAAAASGGDTASESRTDPQRPKVTDGAKDTAANNPAGDLTRQEEVAQMPKAGSANNHSSPSMEESRK